MIKIICVKLRPENCPQTEKIDDVLYLDQNSIFDNCGEWYGEMYVKDENMNFIRHGFRLLNRFKRID